MFYRSSSLEECYNALSFFPRIINGFNGPTRSSPYWLDICFPNFPWALNYVRILHNEQCGILHCLV